MRGSDRSLEVAEWHMSMGRFKSSMIMVGMPVESKCRNQVLKWSKKVVAGDWWCGYDGHLENGGKVNVDSVLQWKEG